MHSPNTPTASFISRAMQLASHPENLSYQFFRECVFWNIAHNNDEVQARVKSNLVPRVLLETVEKFTAETGRPPRVLDLGCGPLPLSTPLHKDGRAEVVAVDVLANAYLELFDQWETEPILDLHEGSGENFLQRFGTFDITFISNALDHTQCPPLTWLNLYRATNVGGYMVQAHAIREATFHNGEQLHRFDLYPEGDHLCFETMQKESVNLTAGLAVTPLGTEHIDIADATHPWFFQTFRKDAEAAPDGELALFIIDQLQREFLALQSWRGRLEGFVNNMAGFERGGLRYSGQHHSALVGMTNLNAGHGRARRKAKRAGARRKTATEVS